MIIYSTASRGQEESKYTLGLDVNILNYNLEGIYKNDINYGYSLLLMERIEKIKVGIGINYSTINYSENVAYVGKIERNLGYLNFPLLIYFNNHPEKKIDINPYIGLIANRLIKYEEVFTNPGEITTHRNRNDISARLGFSFRVGVNFARPIGKHFVLNAAPYADLKFVQSSVFVPKTDELPDYGYAIGFKLGLDFKF